MYNNQIKTILLLSIIFTVLFSNLQNLRIDISAEGFFHKKDQALIDYNKFRNLFGRDELVLIAVYTNDVFDVEFLKALKAFHKEIEDNVPYIDDITSLFNVRNTRGSENELIVEDFLENMPENKADLEILRKRALENPLYKNMIISDDSKITTIMIKTQTYSSGKNNAVSHDPLEGFDEDTDTLDALDGFGNENVSDKDLELDKKYLTDDENSEVVVAVRRISEKYNKEGFEIHISGSSAVTHFLKHHMMSDMQRFGGINHRYHPFHYVQKNIGRVHASFGYHPFIFIHINFNITVKTRKNKGDGK